MSKIAWAWTIIAWFAAACGLLQPGLLPGNIGFACLLSGIAMLPALWRAEDGLFAAIAPPGWSRVMIALLIFPLIALWGTPMGVDGFTLV